MLYVVLLKKKKKKLDAKQIFFIVERANIAVLHAVTPE